MSSAIDICNRALTKLGATTISSFGQVSREAEISGLLYDSVKRAMLAAYPWTFATTDLVMAPEVNAPTDPSWSYQFVIPADAMEVVAVMDDKSGAGISYEKIGRRILADQKSLILRYITDSINETNFPWQFQEAMVARLTYEFAEALDGEGGTIDRAARDAELKLADARTADARSQSSPVRKITYPRNSRYVRAFKGGAR